MDGPLKTIPELGNVRHANFVGLMAQDELQLSLRNVAKAPVSARRTGVTNLNTPGAGADLGTGPEWPPIVYYCPNKL